MVSCDFGTPVKLVSLALSLFSFLLNTVHNTPCVLFLSSIWVKISSPVMEHGDVLSYFYFSQNKLWRGWHGCSGLLTYGFRIFFFRGNFLFFTQEFGIEEG
jgi:hypothetical protein